MEVFGQIITDLMATMAPGASFGSLGSTFAGLFSFFSFIGNLFQGLFAMFG